MKMNNLILNWELRYPVSILGSTRGRVYVSQFLDEWHFGFALREASLAGSTFDISFDGMPGSKYREPQYNINLNGSKNYGRMGLQCFFNRSFSKHYQG
ncbi:MAG: hypothetical protein MZV64_14315 [Ignavibacteriales bacterium]|nr:hypothetical protein [Ignavibacteriales bacterium]